MFSINEACNELEQLPCPMHCGHCVLYGHNNILQNVSFCVPQNKVSHTSVEGHISLYSGAQTPQESLRSCSSAQNIFHHLEAEINTSQMHTHNSSPLICDEAFNTTANVGNNLTVTLSKTRNILRALRKSAYYYRDITTAIAA